MDYRAWMEELDDETNVSKITIPGSHVSAAHFKICSPGVKCQNVPIIEQLNNGVRFLDFRVSKDYLNRSYQVDNLIMVNGKFPVRLSGSYKLKDCLTEIYTFLENNPSETVLVSFKQEGALLNWDYENDEFAKVLFQKYIAKSRRKWYLSTNIPNLGDSRGKIVLIRRFPIKEKGEYSNLGIPSIWDLHDGVYENDICCIQDVKNIRSDEELQIKIGLVKLMFERSNEYHSSKDEPKLFINFCSCSNVMSKQWWPSNSNKKIRKLKIEKSFDKSVGIVVFDFVDRDNWNFIHQLILSNF